MLSRETSLGVKASPLIVYCLDRLSQFHLGHKSMIYVILKSSVAYQNKAHFLLRFKYSVHNCKMAFYHEHTCVVFFGGGGGAGGRYEGRLRSAIAKRA